MTMRVGVILVLVALVGVVLAQQVNLFPVTADGFDTIFLDDMSSVNQISIQTATQDNLSFFVYGDGRMRTVNAGLAGFFVGVTPSENWHVPFIDLHTFRDINGVDLWGVGPLNAIYGRNRSDSSSFQFEIGVVTTKVNPNNSRGRYFLEQPLGFEGLFYSSRIDGFDAQNVVGYFCGFFPPANTSLTNQLYFGVRRAHFNASVFDGPGPYSDAWSSDPSIDDAVLYNHAQLVTFNSNFKPFIFHAWNLNITTDPVNTTYLVVVDPYANTASLIKGNVDPSIPLNVTGFSFVPTYRDFGRIVSAVVYGDLLIVGVKAPGNFSGWIDVLHLNNLTQYTPPIRLPEGFSNPQALVIDWFAPTPTAYIGMNGGNAILRMDLITHQITGYQNLPHYLHSTWAGTATREHIYFVTNEQNSKVFRVNKNDICPSSCMQYGFCQAGKCVCGPDWELRSGECQWKNYIIEKEKVKRNKGGEIALGVLFALTFLAAITGWFLVWRNRRGYQAV